MIQRELWRQTFSLSGRFILFHAENPHVYDEIVALCRKARSRGRDHWSINGIFEVLRWSRMITEGDDFKLNNNHRSYYARLVMAQEPDLHDFFQIRGS